MKIIISIPSFYFIFMLLSASVSLNAQADSYQGFRIHLTHLKVLKQSRESLELAYQAVNTGRQDVQFGQAQQGELSKLLINFDPDFDNNKDLSRHRSAIIAALKQTDYAIVAGKIGPEKVLKVNLNQIDKPVSHKPAPVAQPTPEPVAEATATTVTPEEDKKEPIKAKEEITDDKIIVTDTSGSDDDNDTSDDDYYNPANCPDLRIESIRVLKKNRRSVTIEYTVKNIGKGPADLNQENKSSSDNVAVKAYMTSSDKLTKGALVIGGGYVDNRSQNNGMLLPDETHVCTIKLDINNMTKFTPVIILELDTFEQVLECNETNNKNHVKVR